jgi:polysaccharide export outer membrane protein
MIYYSPKKDPQRGRLRLLDAENRWALMLLILALLSSACTTVAPPPPKTEQAKEQPASDYRLGDDEIRKMNTMIFTQAQTQGDPGEYLLGEGDLLHISVFEAEELESTVRVSSRGFIALPLIESVAVKGLSAIEAEEKIEALYKQGYIKNPHVSIFVEEHVSQRITLVGQFKNPGTYDYPSKRRLLDVIALGGGLGEKAGRIAKIRKSRSVKGRPDAFMIDLDQLITKGNVGLNIEINGGDVIFIPEAGVFFVDGAVKHPGAYAIKHHSTVQEALVEAGGFQPWAVKDKLKLVRMAENGEREIMELDMEEPGVAEMDILDRDILVVDESGAASLMRGFSVTILGTGFSWWGR